MSADQLPCARCGRLLWWSREAWAVAPWLVDSDNHTTCPAPWWRRLLLLAEPHTLSRTAILAERSSP